MNALVTVTSQNYLAGTKVLFHSFLKNNPSCSCELLVIHNGLDKTDRAELGKLFSVRFIEVSHQLKMAGADLVGQLPRYGNKLHRFWSLEAFNLIEYEKVLFLDSDILVRGEICQLFDGDSAFSACPDRSANDNRGRDKITFQKTEKGPEAFNRVFNSGVFLVNNLAMSPDAYQDLVRLLHPDVLAPVTTGHTDQFLLNQYFHGKTYWLKPGYNFLLKDKAASEASASALIWHYLRHPKPWILRPNLYQRLKLKPVSPFIREWHLNYRSVLMYELKGKIRGRIFIRWLYSKLVC
jgi:lipopolysaccharide biosynthesis glycosyltransferase